MVRRSISQRIFLFLLVLLASHSPSIFAAYSMGMGYEPKYPDDFEHFEYVDPQAKRGGNLTLYGLGSFDSLNPFLLKGISAQGLGSLVFESL